MEARYANIPPLRVFCWDFTLFARKYPFEDFGELRVRDTIERWMDNNGLGGLNLSLVYGIVHGRGISAHFTFMKQCNVIFVEGDNWIPNDLLSGLDGTGVKIICLCWGEEFKINENIKLPGSDEYYSTKISCSNEADVTKAIQVGMDTWFSSPVSNSIMKSALRAQLRNAKKLKDEIVRSQTSLEKRGEEVRVLTQTRVELEGKVKNLQKTTQQLRAINRAAGENNGQQKKQIVQLQSSHKDKGIIIQQLTKDKAELEEKVNVTERSNHVLKAALGDKEVQITKLKSVLEEKNFIIKQQAEEQRKWEEEMQVAFQNQERDKERIEQQYLELKENYSASLRALTEWSQQRQNTDTQRKKESKDQLLHVLDSVHSCIDERFKKNTKKITEQVQQTGDHVIGELKNSSASSLVNTSEMSSAEEPNHENNLRANPEMQKLCTTIAKHLGDDWRPFGRELELTGRTLDGFEKRYGKHGSTELVWSVLEKWAKTCENPNKAILIQALQAIQAEYVLRPMDIKHKKTLQSLQPYLLQEMLDIQLLTPYLCRDGILNGTHIQQIMDIPGRRGKNLKFLTMLPSLGDKAFDAFVSALRESSQKHIADKLTGQPGCEDTMHQTTPSIQPPDGNSETGVKQRHLVSSVATEGIQPVEFPSIKTRIKHFNLASSIQDRRRPGHITANGTEVVGLTSSATLVKQTNLASSIQDRASPGHMAANDAEAPGLPSSETMEKQLDMSHWNRDVINQRHMVTSNTEAVDLHRCISAMMSRLEDIKVDTEKLLANK